MMAHAEAFKQMQDTFIAYTKQVLSPESSAEDMAAWVFVYPHFTSASSPANELLAIWSQRYTALVENTSLAEDKKQAELAVLHTFMALWCRTHAKDLGAKQMNQILTRVKGEQNLANELKLIILRQNKKRLTLRSPISSPPMPTRSSTSVLDFMDVPEVALARELTLVEFTLFQDVNPRSLLTVRNQQGDSLFEPLINHYNLISHWVMTEILITKSVCVQVQVLEKFIRLAVQCLSLNNFNTFMEIVSGLNHSTIQRIKVLWERLSERARQQWHEMDSLMSPHHNFRRYRSELKKRKLPVLPYFGIYLRDFTFINDGNRRYMPDGTVNSTYIALLYERVKEVREFQSVPFSFGSTGSPIIQAYVASIASQVIYDEDELYRLSLKAQPTLWQDPIKEADSDGESSDSFLRRSHSNVWEDESEIDIIPGRSRRPSISMEVTAVKNRLRSSSMSIGSSDADDSSIREDRSSSASYIDFTGSSTSNTSRSCSMDDEVLPDNEEREGELNAVIKGLAETNDPSPRIKGSKSNSCEIPVLELKKKKRKSQIAVSTARTGSVLLQRLDYDPSTAVDVIQLPETSPQIPTRPRKKRSIKKAKKIPQTPKIAKVQTVKVGPALDPAFQKTERMVQRYFAECYQSSKTGTISISDERFLMLRASMFSVYFYKTFSETFAGGVGAKPSDEQVETAAQSILFDFGHVMGVSDCRGFMKRMNIKNGLDAAFAGSSHLAYSGWARVEYTQDFNPNAKDYKAQLCHAFSFESESWTASQEPKPQHAACTMSAGYSSGWLQEALGYDMSACEVSCCALGDTSCHFVVAPSGSIQTVKADYHSKRECSAEQQKRYVLHQPQGSKQSLAALSNAAALRTAKSEVVKGIINKFRGRSASLPLAASSPAPTATLRYDAHVSDLQRAKIRKSLIEMGKRNKRMMKNIFARQLLDPKEAKVNIDGQRHLLIRAEGFFYDLGRMLAMIVPEDGQKEAKENFTAKFMFDFGRTLGLSDLRFYVEKLEMQNAAFIEKFLFLPSLLAHVGWGVMRLHTKGASIGTAASELNNFFLKIAVRDCIEASTWVKMNRADNDDNIESMDECTEEARSPSPVCVTTAGYIMGWANECLEASYSRKKKSDAPMPTSPKLNVLEVACAAQGHSRCTFILAPSDGLHHHARQYLDRKKRAHVLKHLHLHLSGSF